MAATPYRGSNGSRQGASAQNGNLVVQTTTIIPEPPSVLAEEGKRRWHSIANILVRRGTWSDDWIIALEHLCRSYDNLREIDLALQQPGETYTVTSTNGRSVKSNPLLDYRLKVEAFIESQLNYFGLTPSSSKGIFTSKGTPGDENKQSVRRRDRSAQPRFEE